MTHLIALITHSFALAGVAHGGGDPSVLPTLSTSPFEIAIKLTIRAFLLGALVRWRKHGNI